MTIQTSVIGNRFAGTSVLFSILDVLARAPRTVGDIARTIDQSVTNTSHHLRRRAGGLVASDKQGRNVTYRLASQRVYDL